MFLTEQFNISKIYNVSYYAPIRRSVYKYPPKLPTYELIYYLEGDTIVNFNNQTINMHTGNLLYMPKGLDNNTYTITINKRFACHNIYFDTFDELPKEAIQFSPKKGDFRAYYEKLYRTWIEKKSGYYYKAMQQTYNILGHLYHGQSNYSPNSKLNYLEPIDDYIAKHYLDADFDYSQLYTLCDLSYSYFKKLFIDKYGCSPVKYITGLKINRACELLLTNQFSISEIAQLCGFENVYYFSNVFKKATGVSPKNYSILDPDSD